MLFIKSKEAFGVYLKVKEELARGQFDGKAGFRDRPRSQNPRNVLKVTTSTIVVHFSS